MLVSISILGPFAGHWYGTVRYILDAQYGGEKVNKKGKSTAYDEGMFWVTLLI